MRQQLDLMSCNNDMQPINNQQHNEYEAFQNLSTPNNMLFYSNVHNNNNNNFPTYQSTNIMNTVASTMTATSNFPLSSASNICNNYAIGQTPSNSIHLSNQQSTNYPSYPQQSFDSNYTSATLTNSNYTSSNNPSNNPFQPTNSSTHSLPFQSSSKLKPIKHLTLPIPRAQPTNNNIINNNNNTSAYKYIAINRIGTGTFGDIWSVIDKYDINNGNGKQRRYAIKMIKNKAHWNTNQRKKYEITFINEGKTIMNLNNIKTNESGKHFIIKCKELLYVSNDNNPVLNLVNNETNQANKKSSKKNKKNKKNKNELPLIGPCIVMELCGYSLLQYIKLHEYTKYKISLPTIRCVAVQIFSAMSFIHGIGNCIHADLKPENILIDYKDCYNSNNKLCKFPRIKIVDFGNAISFNKKLKSFNIQTLWYRSPEVLFGNYNEISSLIDMWSIGCILFELLLINNCNEYCRLFRCKEQDKTAVIYKIYNKLSTFPQYIYNNHKSCHYKDIFINERDEESSYINLKNSRKSKLNNNFGSNIFNFYNMNSQGDTTYQQELVCFIDLLSCLLDVNPLTRYTSEDAIRHRFIINDYKNNHTINTKMHPIIKSSNDIERQNRINMQIKEYQSNNNINKHDADSFPLAISKQHLY